MEQEISRVLRSKKQAMKTYDTLSSIYDWFIDPFEHLPKKTLLQLMDISEGEYVLEIGSGTGQCLQRLAADVGINGRAYGVDISSRMVFLSREKLREAGLSKRSVSIQADAANMPFKDSAFDVVFSSFTLELFDTPEIPAVLMEISRVLRNNGRLGIVSLSRKKEDHRILVELYEAFHHVFPSLVDCRPIFVKETIKDAGFRISDKKIMSLFGLPVEIIVGLNQE